MFEAAGRFPPRHGQPRSTRVHGITAAFPRPTAGPRWHDPAQHGHLAQRSQGCHRWNPISVAFVTVVLTGWLVQGVRRVGADAGAAEAGSPGRVLADAADQPAESWT